MTVTLAALRHIDDPQCPCLPQVMIVGFVDGIKVARLVHNDAIGYHLGTYASTRLWDAAWETGAA